MQTATGLLVIERAADLTDGVMRERGLARAGDLTDGVMRERGLARMSGVIHMDTMHSGHRFFSYTCNLCSVGLSSLGRNAPQPCPCPMLMHT